MSKVKEVCIIEDEVIQVFILRKFFEKTDMVEKVTVYKNGKDALDSMKKRCEKNEPMPDIIFLDLNMPVLDGWQFFEMFTELEESHDTRVHVLTSSLSKFDQEKAIEYGLKNGFYLQKPLSYEKINEILRDYLENEDFGNQKPTG